MKRILWLLGLSLAFSWAVSSTATAHGYPDRPIKFIVGYPPGGGNDILGRLVAKGIGQMYGQSVIVENKPGAGGDIAAEYAAKSVPDGYTILVGSSGTMTVNPATHSHLPFNVEKDFAPITLFAANPLVLAVNPSLKVRTLKQLIALAKSEPGKLSYGAGAPPFYVTAKLLDKEVGANMVYIPYKGSGHSIMAAVAGQVPVVIVSVEPAMPEIRAGKLIPLAVTSKHRYFQLPKVPTIAEATGLKKFESGGWVGLFAPVKVPKAKVDKLYHEVAAVLKSKGIRRRLHALGYETNGTGMSPAAFNRFFRYNLAKWTKVTHQLHIHYN